MKKRDDSLERYEHSSLINSIVSGIILILIFIGGEIFCIYSLFTSSEDSSYIFIFMFILLLFGIGGVLQITMKSREKKKEERKYISGTSENTKYERNKEISIQKIRDKSQKHGSFFKELYIKPLIISFISLVVVTGIIAALYFLAAMDHSQYDGFTTGIGVLVEAVMLLVFVFSLSGFNYRKAKKVIKKDGLDFEDIEREFLEGSLYSSGIQTILCIGQLHSFYFTGSKFYVINNTDIRWVYLYTTKVFQYTNGIYNGSRNEYSIKIGLFNGAVYTIPIPMFADHVIVADYMDQHIKAVYGYSDFRNEAFSRDPYHFLEILHTYEK